MSSLGSQLSELDGLQKSKSGLENWISTQENNVAEMLQRPCKFRSDAAQVDLNLISDLKQTILEKQALLDDLELREQGLIGNTPDYNLSYSIAE